MKNFREVLRPSATRGGDQFPHVPWGWPLKCVIYACLPTIGFQTPQIVPAQHYHLFTESRFAVGHIPTHDLDEMIHQLNGQEKYRLLISGLSDAAQKQYFRFWLRWMTFQHLRNKAPWLNPQTEGWDGDLSGWILYYNKVVGISASAIQGIISALKNIHLVCGKADLTKSGNRFERLLNATKLKAVPKTKRPFRPSWRKSRLDG